MIECVGWGDLDDVLKNDNGTTFRRPNWVVAVAQ